MNGLLGGTWTPEAVVFDCDGLLVDSEPCWTVAETELFARYGLSFTPEYKARLIGKSLPAAARVMAELFGEPESAGSIQAELLALVTEVVSKEAEAMPGAAELVALAASVVPVAVASNAPRALLDAALARGGFSGVFPISIAADEVSAPKPDPEMYSVACGLLGSSPAGVLAFEDSMTGLASARAAGVRVVGVPTLRHHEFPADAVVASLCDPSLLGWVSGWSTASAV
jgi:HAD superfamily hydrolase (TIGR01509 family)